MILLGDFNDPPENKRFKMMTESVSTIKCLFVDKGCPDSTQTCPKSERVRTTITDTSLYDNICFQPQHVTEYADSQGIVKFDEIEFNNNDKKASLSASDHRPIWAVFNIGTDDD